MTKDDPRHSSLDTRHFSYFRSFFREAGYRFPEEPAEAQAFCVRVDEELSGDEYSYLWDHLVEAGRRLEAPIDPDALAGFLLDNSRTLYLKR